MADVNSAFYPTRHIDPNEPGLQAAYCFQDGELAVHGRYLNRAALGGAALDLATRSGTPIIGPSGGMMAVDHGSWWQGTTVDVGALNFAYALEIDFPTTPGANQVIYQNGGGTHAIYNSLGIVAATLTGGASTIVTPYNVVGRGPALYHVLYDGVTCYLLANGTVADFDAVVALNTNVGLQYMRGPGDHRAHRVYNRRLTVAQARASYVRDFASKVLWQWQPRDVGEGPAGGILTGSYSGVGGWTCPLGAATMSFVWRNDLSDPAGGRLTLTDTQKVNLNRIDFEYGSRPWFNSWLVEYEVRDPATDDMIIGWTPRRGVDPTAAGSQSYYMRCWTAAGPWWRVGLFYENGAQIDGADAPFPGPVAGDRCKALITRDVDGSIQTWNYVPSPQRGWWWTTAVGNNVATLAEGNICIAPRGCYVERVTAFQSSMTPHELEAVLP